MSDAPDPVEAVAQVVDPDAFMDHEGNERICRCRGCALLRQGAYGLARAAIDALEEAGYAVVSQEPTEAMMRAGNQAIEENAFPYAPMGPDRGIEIEVYEHGAAEVFRTMLAARPGNDGGQSR